MLINLWYVAEWSDTVKDKPVKVKMLGQNLVLFRDGNGKVHCLSDVCLHRGGSLSGGWTTKRNCVACPYHGWEFNGEGKVKFIPSLGEDGNIPDRARIDAYPTEERYGMIWVFLGDIPEEERYPIPPLPEFDNPKWKMLRSDWTWQAEGARVVENGIDIAHASFVHSQFGKQDTAGENFIEHMEAHDHWASSTNVMYPPRMTGIRRFIRKEGQETRVIPTFWMPGYTIRLHVILNKRMEIIMFDANTPIDDKSTRTFALQFRNFFKSRLFDKGSEKRLIQVFQEDAEIIEAAAPNYLPENLANEMSVEQDRFMSSFRRMRKKCIEEKGWQIDSYALKPYEGRKVFTIPSPERRKNPELNWVLDTVPLVPKKSKPLQVVEEIEETEIA